MFVHSVLKRSCYTIRCPVTRYQNACYCTVIQSRSKLDFLKVITLAKTKNPSEKKSTVFHWPNFEGGVEGTWGELSPIRAGSGRGICVETLRNIGGLGLRKYDRWECVKVQSSKFLTRRPLSLFEIFFSQKCRCAPPKFRNPGYASAVFIWKEFNSAS